MNQLNSKTICYFEFSHSGFPCLQDKRAGIKKKKLLFFTLILYIIHTPCEKPIKSIFNLRMPEIDEISTRSYYRKAFATLMELITTERTYVTRDLEKAMEFIEYCKKSKAKGASTFYVDGVEPMPEELRKGRDKIAFGNIQEILIFHRK